MNSSKQGFFGLTINISKINPGLDEVVATPRKYENPYRVIPHFKGLV